MAKPLTLLGDLRVGAELLAAADVRSVRALTGNPDDTRVIARFSWHRSIADVRASATSVPLVDDPAAWTLIPGAMRPAYQCTEDDAGRWLRVTVLPLPTSSSGGRWPGNLESQASGTGPASNRPTLRAMAGPIMLQWSPAREQAPSQESQPQQSRLVVVEGQYTAVADGSHRLMVHLSPDNRTAECKARKEQQLQQLPPETQHSVGPQHGHRLAEQAQLYAQPVRSAVVRPSATLPTGLDEDRLASVNHVQLSMPEPNLIQQQAQISRLATNSSPCAPLLSPTRQPAKSNSSESSGHPSVPRAPSPVRPPHERPRFSEYSGSKHASLDATRYDSSGPAGSHLPPPAASIRELPSPNMKSSPGRGRSASPSSRPAGRLHEVIAGNYALSELQQWATGMALQQMSQSPQRSDAAAVPRPPASQYDNELQKLLKLAEDAGSSREPWLTNSDRSSSAQSVHTVPSQGCATALPTERRQWHGSSPPELRPDQKSCLPSNAQPWRARPDSVPIAVGTGPDGPQQPLAGSRNDIVGSITEQLYWKRLLPEHHPEQLEMPGASQSKCERSPRHEGYTAHHLLLPSPFGGRDANAYASAAAAGREARVSSQLPPQRLETVFQSTQDPQLGQSARRGDRVDEDVALSCLRDRLSAWQSQRSPNNGATAPSTASAGAGMGTGGGSLREALEQLLAQHQEVVQQAALDAAASRISPQHQFPATAPPPLPDRHSMLAVERPGLQKSSAPEMRPYNSDDAARSGYQLGRQPLPPSQLQARLALDAHQSRPLVSRGSGASSVSLSNAFGVGLSGGITGRGITSHGLGSNDSDEEAGPSKELHNASPLGSLRTPGIDVAGESRKSPKVAVRERHGGHVAQPLQHAQVELDTEAVSAGLGLGADKSSTSADEYSKAGSDTAALLAQLVEQGAEVGEKGSRSAWRLEAVGLPVMGKPSGAVDALDARIGAPIGGEHTIRRSDGRGDACGCNSSHAGKDSQPASQQAPSAAPASSSLQDMRNMNEALLRQLAESTRLQMQMQKALDAAMEQLIAFHAKEQQQQQRPEAAALTSPPRISSHPRQSPPAPQAPGSQLVVPPPRQAPPPPDRPLSPSQQRLAAWIRDTAVEPAPPVGLTLPPRGFSSPPHRRLPHADAEVHSPIRRAASPEPGAVAQTGPEILRCTGAEAACMKTAGTEDGNTTAARHRKVAMGPVSGTGAAGIRAGGGNGTGTGDDDAIAAAALRALLHQHHLRWRAKKAKLKEQAQAWQYTAWRYATAWKKARAMLQGMVAAQEGAVAPVQSIVNELRRPHHNLSLPQDNTVPKDVRPLASEVPAPPASTAVRQAEAGPVPGRATEGSIDLRKLTEPGILAGITAALQRRDPSPGSVAGQRPSAYPTSDQGRLTGATQSPGQVYDLALGARGPGGKAISAMRDAARTSPMRLRPRPHRKRATATAAAISVLREDERDDMLLPPDKYHADKDERCKHSSLDGCANPGNDVALDSGRDQGSRDYRAARRHDGADTAVNLERMEVAAHWPGTLRSGTDGRPRSTSPFSRPPWRNAGCASPTGIRVHRPVLDRDLPAQPDLSWPLLPPEHPQPPKPPAVPYRDPDGWWHYPDGWLDIYQPRLPHMLVQSTTVRPQRHHHRYGSQGKVAPGGVINEFHLT